MRQLPWNYPRSQRGGSTRTGNGTTPRRLDKVEQLSMTLNDYGATLLAKRIGCKGLDGSERNCRTRTYALYAQQYITTAMYGLRSSKRWHRR